MKRNLRRSRITYLCIIIFAVIFTQALRTPLSTVLFWLVLTLPALTLIYAVLTLMAVRYSVTCQSPRIERGGVTTVSCIIENASVFPVFYLEANLVYPDEAAININRSTRELTLFPMSRAAIQTDITFGYRGKFKIGFESIVVYDLLRLFSLRLKTGRFVVIEVSPRSEAIELFDNGFQAAAGEASGSHLSHIEKTDIFGIREYLPGDSLKSIHWKLSSKTISGEFNPLVKIYANDDTRRRYVLCDLEERAGALPAEARAETDAAVEVTLACVLSGVRNGEGCTVLWYDHGQEDIHAEEITCAQDYNKLFRAISFVESYQAGCCPGLSHMMAACTGTPESMELYLITAQLSPELFKAVSVSVNVRTAVFPVFLSFNNKSFESEKALLRTIGIGADIVNRKMPIKNND
ncbi:MAG: DUF58 domain-containing protein [Oscillospiraceae bacterium]|nr:DUF58 domain-containing protein [Oscillospiraceae bacterium]